MSPAKPLRLEGGDEDWLFGASSADGVDQVERGVAPGVPGGIGRQGWRRREEHVGISGEFAGAEGPEVGEGGGRGLFVRGGREDHEQFEAVGGAHDFHGTFPIGGAGQEFQRAQGQAHGVHVEALADGDEGTRGEGAEFLTVARDIGAAEGEAGQFRAAGEVGASLCIQDVVAGDAVGTGWGGS